MGNAADPACREYILLLVHKTREVYLYCYTRITVIVSSYCLVMNKTDDRLEAAFRDVAHFHEDEIAQVDDRVPLKLQLGTSFTRFFLR